MLFIWSCSEHSVQPYQPELANGRIVGSVHGVVTDFCSNAIFDTAEVSITWAVNGELKSTVTNRLGYYIITDLPSGDYVITFSGGSQYAISRVTVTIPELNDILDCCPLTDSSYHHSVTQNVTLYKKNAGLKGKIYKRESDLSITAAQGVTVVADYTMIFSMDEEDSSCVPYEGYNVYPGKYTTITDSEGFFTFDSLPGTHSVLVYTMPHVEGSNEWGMEYTPVPLIQNATVLLDDLILEIATPVPFIVQSNFIGEYKFQLSDDIFATFSKRINPSFFFVELSFYDDGIGDWKIVEHDTSWTDNITLTIDPYVDLLPGTEYTLTLNGRSIDGHSFEMKYTFRTQQGIEFVSTNLERAQDIYDQFPVDSDIYITFSMPVNPNHMYNYLALYDSEGLYVVTNLSYSSDMKTLIISHPDSLESGHEYTLEFRIYSNIAGDFIEGQFTFWTASDLQPPAAVTGFSLNMGTNWNADWNTTTVSFWWYSVANAETYYIFAKDNYQNSDRVFLGEFDAQDILTSQTGQATLPEQFDYFQDDGIQTPFLNNTDVSYYIAAYNAAGMSPLSGPITIGDGTSPSILLSNQSSSADNSANASSITITIDLTSTTGEYLSSVTYSVAEAGGDPGYTLPLSAIAFSWNTPHYNKTGGTIAIVVPANENGSGDTITVNCLDTSGNTGSFTLTLN